MNSILALSMITFKEGIRNRTLYGIALLALFLFGLNITVAGFFMRDIGKVSVDMNLAALTVAGILLVLFVGINLMAKDIDKKTIQLVLSKPITRTQYIIGKYLGIILFVSASLIVLVLFSSTTILVLRTIYIDYFENFSWGIFFIACSFIFIKMWVLVSVVVFFSSITTSSLITLIFSSSVYVAGVTIEEVVFYIRTELASQEEIITESLKDFIDIVSYVLPNLSVYDFSIEAAHGIAVESHRIFLSLGYSFFYIAILLILAAQIFLRREFN